eukprot:TRINITY_DN4729_c0_g1_i1.p1 TRINITY_DN4729_c0_g1~~TRINITY_DN4729_c0_g1_i1.p1  ORF type:complete len:1235 (-),score=374.74 TRINITY_DN4729_c0_g1_i1:275-3979(-)
MGRVHEIVVENFKSYQGRVQIGPFRHFTCVIGPNGAGKSNLMDAISFVLGVQARQLRSERLRDLVYRKEGEDPKKNERTAFVELTYEDEEAPEGEQRLVFRRLIARTGEAKFQVNDVAMSQADYHKRLEGINILSKVRNFLVFQGDVEAVAQRQGKDLTAFFEQISGSEALRQEYDRLAAEKSKKEDQARYLFTKKRNAINERKRVSHQKQEADEYRQLETQRRDLQREYILFRLHGIASQLERTGSARASAEQEKELMQKELDAGKASLESADRERAQARMATQHAEKEFAAIRSKLDRINPERVGAKSKLAFLQQRLDDVFQGAEKDGRRRSKLQEQADALSKEQARLEAEQEAMLQGVAQREQALAFTPEQRQEFERVKKATESIAASSGDALRQLETQVRAVHAERVQVESDQRDALARRDHLQKRLSELSEAEASATELAERGAAARATREAELAERRARAAQQSGEKEQLQQERQELLDTIQDITANERQVQRERELASVCKSLADACPGVHGRVVDLCQPSQKRLRVAVNVALAKFLDAIVVDSSESAKACVRYLKERMLPPMTFLPMADLRVAALDPRLQELVNSQRGMRLGLNCVTFDERFERAIQFLLGDVVVADTMADGRRLAFGEARQMGVSCKVVTLAGEAIAKNGNLSVNSEAATEGATRFDVSDLESTKARLEAIDRRLLEIHSMELAGGADVAALEQELRRTEGKAEEGAVRRRWCQEQLKEKRQELRAAEALLAQAAPEALRLAREEDRLREEQRAIEARVGEAVAGHFAHLNEALGVDDVRQLEREWRREQEMANQRGTVLNRQLMNMKAELSMLRQTLQEQATKDPQELIPQLQREVEELTHKEAELGRAAEKLEAEIAACEARVGENSETEREREKALTGLRQRAKERRQQLMAAEKKLADLGSEERAMVDARTNILRQSVLEDIEVPFLRGGAEALQDLAAESQAASSASSTPGDAGAIIVDFSLLPEEKQAASGPGPAAQMLEEEYRSELERFRVELERLSPNLKAIDQMQGVAENVQAASSEADAARRDIEDIEAKFQEVRKERKERFMECFKAVAEEIGSVYRRLTANTAGLHADGGSAYLDLEDTDDPFNGGVKFTAMPPAKRFRDMHLLSGGEKTLAAMALLFAVHAYQRPPFMVLDEVDAALDANNVRAISNFVENQAKCQTIVISLKDRFFVRGQALVGVWKNKPQETSAVLTLDLTKYLDAASGQ